MDVDFKNEGITMMESDATHPILEEVKGKLTRSGYKLTPQRGITLEILIKNQTELMTAEEIFIAVKDVNPSIGLATVYRTLDILFELEIVKKIPYPDGMSRYELNISNDGYRPYYLLCIRCGKINEINEPLIEAAKKRVEQKYHFQIETHHLTFHGICKDCLEMEKGDIQVE